MAVLKRCVGLNTFGNEINEAEGALDIADNCVIDADDTIEVRRGFADFGTSLPILGDRVKQLLTYKGRILRHYNDIIQFDSTGAGVFQSFSGAYNELISGLRLKGQEMNGNFYFTTNDGIKKISATNASQFTTSSGYITNAGGPKAIDIQAELEYTPGGYIPPQSKVAYRALWGYRDTNGNLIYGYPSPRFVLANTSQDVNTPEKFELIFGSNNVTDYDGTVDDRYILFSSVNTDYFLWFSSVAFPDAPQDADTLGRTGLEVNIEGLSSAADIAVSAATKIAQLTQEFSVSVVAATVTVTSKEEGEDLLDASTSAALTAVTLTVKKQGSVSEGLFANANITITIPNDVTTTDYFYQLYRTANITATVGLDLASIDPGDEMNLVYEANVTDADLTAGTVTFEDITTEAFRVAGVFLYTNPNTGEGILQANEKPPIAQDITLFRGSAFYANTRTAHRKQFNLISVSDFTSGISSVVVGNSDAFREYTFVGEEEESEIITDSYANTDDTGYILINSANNERKYSIWFDKGSTIDPSPSDRISIRVEIDTGFTDVQVAEALSNTLDLMDDFDSSYALNTVVVTCAKNGNVTDLTIGSPLTNAWAVSVTTQGDGEDTSLNEVLLSNNVSVAQSIEETALSLVRVINADSSSVVNAYYLSGAEDVPGIILFEAKNLEDNAFFVGTTDSNIQTKFTPELPVVETITNISVASPTVITSAAHGLSSGTKIYIYDTDSSPAIMGEYEITYINANTFSVPVEVFGAGTTGKYFLSTFASDNLKSPNRLYYSKPGQPEAVPLVNYIDIGPKDQEIFRILALRDSLFVLKQDGVYIVTGSSAPDFSSRLLDSSAQIIAPDSAQVLNNQIYALTTQGVVRISEGQVRVASRPIEDRILGFIKQGFDFKYTCFGASYETDRSYFIWAPTVATDTVATQCYRYNTFTDTWTRWTVSATSALVNPSVDKLYVGAGNLNVVFQERKLRDRTDYSDRNFTRGIVADSVNAVKNTIQLSSTTGVEVGDVIYQDQYVTLAFYNRLLRKLDIDMGMENDYFSTLEMVPGDTMKLKLDELNAKLVADDASSTVTAVVFSTDLATQQTQLNDMMAELNDTNCDTLYKDYQGSTGTTPYEAIIIAVSQPLNTVTVNYTMPFTAENAQIYKNINMVTQWVPQHFGASDMLKQVREGTIIFDQNNFYSASVSYASDRSANFEKIEFKGGGVGYWGGTPWGEFVWGGEGNEVPKRTLIPREKQRCRHIKVRFNHINAREGIRIIGISLEPRQISTKAYR
jgi:hypothetical protein